MLTLIDDQVVHKPDSNINIEELVKSNKQTERIDKGSMDGKRFLDGKVL